MDVTTLLIEMQSIIGLDYCLQEHLSIYCTHHFL